MADMTTDYLVTMEMEIVTIFNEIDGKAFKLETHLELIKALATAELAKQIGRAVDVYEKANK